MITHTVEMQIQEGEIYQSIEMNANGIPATVFHSRRLPEGDSVFIDIIVIRPAPPPHVIVSPDNDPIITIFRKNATIATSPIIFDSKQIPEGGFDYIDITRMASRLFVSSVWLYDQLDCPGFGGVVLRPLRALTLISAIASSSSSVPDHEVCVICLMTKAESSDDWATALGCESHSFHSACIQHWARTNRTCPTCRAPLS